MSKGYITVEGDGGPIVVDFDVQTDEQSFTVEITPTEVKVHTKNEPKVVPT